jgi:hypothetical protein
MARESDIQLLARGVRRALSGQGSAFTAEDFERLEAIEHGESQPEPEPQLGEHARPA